METQIMTDGKTSQLKGICSFCGHETWHCSHGGHCFSWQEFFDWEAEHGKSKEMTEKVRELISNFIPEPCCIECGCDEARVLTQSRGEGIWSCWDCDNKAMQQEGRY